MVGKGPVTEHFLQRIMGEGFLLEDENLQLLNELFLFNN
jgi:hypothetical protein